VKVLHQGTQPQLRTRNKTKQAFLSSLVVEVLHQGAQPQLRTRNKTKQAFLSSLVVEVPGIEPGSFGAKTGLLRA